MWLCVCAGLGVQLCGSAGAAVQVLPSPRVGRGAAGGRHLSPCHARRAGSGRAAGRSRVNHSLGMLW